jgi:hypothetical protein
VELQFNQWKLTNPKSIQLGNNKYINTILFADDQVLLAETEDHLQENVAKLNKILKLYNMRISTNKTKALAMEGKYMRRTKIIIDDIGIEQTSSFKYLGCNISIYKMNMDLEDSVQKYCKLNGCIKRYMGNKMRKEIKLRLHDIISKPALQYGSETCVLRAEDKRRIETSEMRFLRFVLGVSLRDKISSENIRKKLNTERMVEEMQEYQKKWRNHVERMPPERLPWQTYSCHPIGRRDIGRPRRRCRQQFL